jgi:hypothetical protein
MPNRSRALRKRSLSWLLLQRNNSEKTARRGRYPGIFEAAAAE